ncbi:MAG: polyhydroxyalkanoate synthesis regulator DNA-binding domain-containing protein [Gammaproteobacteria bacterium]
MARIIKKYSNRRLYDTETSSYITLEALKQFVLNYTDIQVIDAKSGQDLTLDCLFNILLEQENQSPIKLFSKNMLENLIRSYVNHLQILDFQSELQKGMLGMFQNYFVKT